MLTEKAISISKLSEKVVREGFFETKYPKVSQHDSLWAGTQYHFPLMDAEVVL